MTRHAPITVSILALVLAVVGTAVAGTSVVSKVTKSSVKTIAKKQAGKQITTQAPGLSVAHATTAATASTADTASTAITADTAGLATHATTADTATTADNATNATRLGGVGAGGFISGGGRIEAASGTVPNDPSTGQQLIYRAPRPFGEYLLNCNPGANSDVSNVHLLNSGAKSAWVQQQTSNQAPAVVSSRGAPPGASFGPDFDVQSAQAHETWHEAAPGSNALTVDIWIQSTGANDATCVYSLQATLTQ
jgi:hypothetical protein